jgi:hypothetical protein
MDQVISAAKHSAELAKRLIDDQDVQVARQRQLIASLEQNGHSQLLQQARDLLEQMLELLAQMRCDGAAAERRLQELGDPLDEASLELVMRDCPL